MVLHFGSIICDWKCGSGKCDTGKNARVENAGVAYSCVESWTKIVQIYTALGYFMEMFSHVWPNKVWILLQFILYNIGGLCFA